MPIPSRLARGSVLAGLLLCLSSLQAAPGLPDSFDPDPRIPTPVSILGFEPGEQHPRNDQIVAYLEALAEASDRVRVERTGHSEGGRELVLAYFAHPERLENLDSIRQDRRRASREGRGPAVVWLGYSVHGNEASGASAALVTAWYLAAARDAEVERWLDELVIVMEPVLNPDGLDRFAHWVNMHRGRHPSGDPLDREHNEAWPNGRTSYYWFDLNRDWLPLTHSESRIRMGHYHQWRPHVLTDAHEMGHNSTYFFQPGVPERNNPMTPQRNFELTGRLAEFHGEVLDEAGEPHFTRELFDDYYIGKGSTYPDLTGGVGILFEQGSARGHLMNTPWGERTFADAVANQVRTSLSTVRGSLALADELIDYQADFFRRASAESGGWLLGDGGDPARAARLIEILLGHDIQVRPVSAEVTIDGRIHEPGSAWVIPGGQDQHRLIEAIFHRPVDLPMDTFYDVSAWPLQLAFDLPLDRAQRLPAAGEPLAAVPAASPPPLADGSPSAWIVPWNQHRAPAVLAALLADGYRVQAATRPLTTEIAGGPRRLVRGSLVIHPGIQEPHLAPVRERLAGLSDRYGVEVLAARRGLSVEGPDLGSPSVPMLTEPKPALLTGSGLNSYSAGYIWHWFDTRLEQPLVQRDWLGLVEGLDGYTHLILPDGNYEHMPQWVGEQVLQFVQRGGQLLAIRQAATWVESLELEWAFADNGQSEEESESAPVPAPEPRPFDAFTDDFARQLIGGSALWMEIDQTHPLLFGIEQERIAVFRRGSQVLRPLANAYAHPGRYPDEPLAAGFLSEENRERLAGTPALAVSRHGPGRVIRIADDFLFRGYFAGTERMFANALFFSGLIGETEMPEPD